MVKKIEGDKPVSEKIEVNRPGTLSAEEMARLDKEAQDEVEQEAAEKRSAEYKEQRKLALKKKALFTSPDAPPPGSESMEIFIDLAKHSDRIRLDNKIYVHGRSYPVTPEVYATLKDIMYRTWKHEAEIHGQNENAYAGRRSRGAKV